MIIRLQATIDNVRDPYVRHSVCLCVCMRMCGLHSAGDIRACAAADAAARNDLRR